MHAVERAGGQQRLERLDDDDVPALHVDDARPACLPFVQPLELLKRTVGLEDGVEMANQENPPARPRTVGDEMSSTFERRPVDPSRREAQGGELGGEEFSDLAHARMVLRAAVDVDRALEQRQRLGIVRVHVGDDGALVGGKGRRWLAAHGGRHQDHCSRDGQEPAHEHRQ